MKDLVLTIEQCRHLQELGLDMSDAKLCHVNIIDGVYRVGFVTGTKASDEYVSTYTLQEILDRLPFEISDKNTRFELFIDYPHDTVFYYNFSTHKESHSEQSESHNILDSAYNMLCWVIENGFLKTK